MCGVNVCKPPLSSALAQLSSNQYFLCLLSEWEGQRKRNIQFGIHVKYLEAIGKIFGYISFCKITWRFLENMLSFQKMFGKHLRKILTWICRIILYNTFSMEVIWTLLLICTCIHFNSEFSLLLGSYLQLRHYIKKPVALFFFSCDGIKVRTFTFAHIIHRELNNEVILKLLGKIVLFYRNFDLFGVFWSFLNLMNIDLIRMLCF